MPCNMQFWTSSIPGSSEVLPGAPATLYYTILCCPYTCDVQLLPVQGHCRESASQARGATSGRIIASLTNGLRCLMLVAVGESAKGVAEGHCSSICRRCSGAVHINDLQGTVLPHTCRRRPHGRLTLHSWQLDDSGLLRDR